MLRNIFCGCTSNKNIQNDVITLDIKDDINTEEEKETELELLEKEEEEEINKDSSALDSPELASPELETMQNTKEIIISEEDEEIIDILTQKPVEKAEESKTTTRKYLFF